MDKTELIRSARRQGLSDGYYGYPSDPGDFTGEAKSAYITAWAEGQSKGEAMNRWERNHQ